MCIKKFVLTMVCYYAMYKNINVIINISWEIINKQESWYFRVASIFDKTFILLSEQKEIEYITVKEICGTSDFKRSALYLHYEWLDDLLNETLKHTIDKLILHFDEMPENFIIKINVSKKRLNFINEKIFIILFRVY